MHAIIRILCSRRQHNVINLRVHPTCPKEKLKLKQILIRRRGKRDHIQVPHARPTLISSINCIYRLAVKLDADEAAEAAPERLEGQGVLGAWSDVGELREGCLSEADIVDADVLVYLKGKVTSVARGGEGICSAFRDEGTPRIVTAFEVAVLEDFVRGWSTCWGNCSCGSCCG